MSTIERAILGDDVADKEAEKTEAGSSSVEVEKPAVEKTETVTSEAQAPISKAQDSPPSAREVTEEPRPRSSVVQPSPMPPIDPSAPPRNFVDVDLENLSEQGFILPETGPQRLAEEYRHIKRRILGNVVPGILDNERPVNLIMITSSVPGEGKTFTSMNIALSIAAELDKTVLVVDADIVKSDLSRAFNMQREIGLFDYLENPSIGVESIIYRTSISSLSLIPAGRSDIAISEKLASGTMRRLTDEIAERYSDRIVIFDCPPILATSGASSLAPHVSQIIMVVEARDTSQAVVRDALSVIGDNRVTGLVLNKSKSARSHSGYYYYGYGYNSGEST